VLSGLEYIMMLDVVADEYFPLVSKTIQRKLKAWMFSVVLLLSILLLHG